MDKHQDVYRRFNPKLAKIGNVVDTISPILLLLDKCWTRPINSAPLKILLFESHLIGDTVLAIPLLHSLRIAYPASEIHVLGNPWIKDILAPLGLADEIITQRIPWVVHDYSINNIYLLFKTIMHLRSHRYDLVLEPRGDFRNIYLLWCFGPARRLGYDLTGGRKLLTDVVDPLPENAHLLDHKYNILRGLGIPHTPIDPYLIIEPDTQEEVDAFYTQLPNNDRPWVGFHPGASQSQRRLGLEMKIQILRTFLNANYQPILFGSPAEEGELHRLASHFPDNIPIFVGDLSLSISAMNHLDAIVTMDSGPSHIAAALGLKTVVIVENHKVGITTPRGKLVALVSPKYSSDLSDISVIEILSKLEALLHDQLLDSPPI